MARVLVTGAMGLLGTTLVESLRDVGHRVVTHGRSAGDVVGDLVEIRCVERVVAESTPDCIVNLVALTNVDQCERSPHLAFLNNARVVENLAAVIGSASHDAPHLIQLSTDQLYDGAGPHAEEDVVIANYYAFSKYAAELAAARVRSTVLRTNFFGPSRRSGRKSFSDWLVDSLLHGEEIRVFTDVKFSPLSIERLSEVIAAAIARPTPGVFNVASREGMSKAEFCFELARVLKLPTASMRGGSVADADLVAHRPTDMRMDPAKFEKAFGLRMPVLAAEIESMKRQYDVDAR